MGCIPRCAFARGGNNTGFPLCKQNRPGSVQEPKWSHARWPHVGSEPEDYQRSSRFQSGPSPVLRCSTYPGGGQPAGEQPRPSGTRSSQLFVGTQEIVSRDAGLRQNRSQGRCLDGRVVQRMLRKSEPPSGRVRGKAMCSASRTNLNPMAANDAITLGLGASTGNLAIRLRSLLP
jgi:hypothetical protein